MNDDLKNAKLPTPARMRQCITVVKNYVMPGQDGWMAMKELSELVAAYESGLLVPERPLKKLKAGDVIPHGAAYLVRYRETGNVKRCIQISHGGGRYLTSGEVAVDDYFLDPIPSLPPVEPDPVKAPQFIGVVRHKKCGATMFVSFMGNLDINGIDDRGEVYSCRDTCDWERDSATAAANNIQETPEFLAAFK